MLAACPRHCRSRDTTCDSPRSRRGSGQSMPTPATSAGADAGRGAGGVHAGGDTVRPVATLNEHDLFAELIAPSWSRHQLPSTVLARTRTMDWLVRHHGQRLNNHAPKHVFFGETVAKTIDTHGHRSFIIVATKRPRRFGGRTGRDPASIGLRVYSAAGARCLVGTRARSSRGRLRAQRRWHADYHLLTRNAGNKTGPANGTMRLNPRSRRRIAAPSFLEHVPGRSHPP